MVHRITFFRGSVCFEGTEIGSMGWNSLLQHFCNDRFLCVSTMAKLGSLAEVLLRFCAGVAVDDCTSGMEPRQRICDALCSFARASADLCCDFFSKKVSVLHSAL